MGRAKIAHAGFCEESRAEEFAPSSPLPPLQRACWLGWRGVAIAGLAEGFAEAKNPRNLARV